MVNSEDKSVYENNRFFIKPKRRSWPVTILALFLAIQGIALFGLATYHINLADFSLVLSPFDLIFEHPNEFMGISYGALGALGLFASISFLNLWKFAWILAILQQFITLAVAIALYFQGKPFFIFPMMIYGIMMVIYLNYSDVINSFQTRPMTDEWGGIDEE